MALLRASTRHGPEPGARAVPGTRSQGLGPPAREENAVPKGCPLVMADFAAGQWQVKFQQRPQSGGSVAPWISLVPYTEDARKTQDKPGIKATEVPSR